MKLWRALACGAALAALASGVAAAQAAATAVDPGYAKQATAGGAQEVTVTPRADGGLILGGRLEGRQFAVAIPQNWNHQFFVFAHGYSTPDSPVAVSTDPVAKDPGLGMLAAAYAQGFAVGHSAYDKAGLGVEAGSKATLRLQQLLKAMGATRSYVGGGSMGGGIVVVLLEQHPDVFAGGLSACGVDSSWEEAIGGIVDMRALYNYFSRGTAYALPGEQDIARSAVPTLPPAGSTTPPAAFQMQQTLKLAGPIVKLMNDAQRQPEGQAGVIVRKLASVSGFAPEPASFLLPLITAAMGMDDIRATAGGAVYGNRTKHYAGSALGPAETTALNRDIQRVDASPEGLRYIRKWHTATGVFRAPLVAIHNQIDSLVPYNQATGLEAKVAAAGDPRRFTLITVSPQRIPIPGTGVSGYAHCGFDAKQVTEAWNTLRRMSGD